MSKTDTIDAICDGLRCLFDLFFFSPFDYQIQVLCNAIAFFEGKTDIHYLEDINRIAHNKRINVLTYESRLFVLRVYLGYLKSFDL